MKMLNQLRHKWKNKYTSYMRHLQRRKVKAYDHVISIGLNCETSSHLLRKYGAIESSLFSWGGVFVQPVADDKAYSLADIIANPKLVFGGEIQNRINDNDFYCDFTKTAFHGKSFVQQLKDENGQFRAADLLRERDDTIGRINYLSDKFMKVAALPDTKLYVLGIQPHFFPYPETDLYRFITDVFNAILRNTLNGSLLVVVPRSNFSEEIHQLDDNKRLFIRFVNYFTPNEHVNTREYMDLDGWDLILDEFIPTRLKKKRTFIIKINRNRNK